MAVCLQGIVPEFDAVFICESDFLVMEAFVIIYPYVVKCCSFHVLHPFSYGLIALQVSIEVNQPADAAA